jgi:hypothetical protein
LKEAISFAEICNLAKPFPQLHQPRPVSVAFPAGAVGDDIRLTFA